MNARYNPENKNRKIWIWWIFAALFFALLLAGLTQEYFRSILSGIVSILPPILIGLMLAFLMKGILRFLEEKLFRKMFKDTPTGKTWRRIISIMLIFVLLIALFVLIALLVIPQVQAMVSDISSNVNEYVSRISEQLTAFVNELGLFADVDLNEIITNAITNFGQKLTESLPIITNNLLQTLQQTATYMLWILLGFIISFLILKDKEKIKKLNTRVIYATFNETNANSIMRGFSKCDKVLYDYVWCKIIEAACVFALMLPGFFIFGVPYAIPLTFLLAILNFIPYIGLLLAQIPIVLITILFVNVSSAIWLVVYINVMSGIIAYFISPFIYGSKLNVSALTLIVSMFVFGGVFGIWGMLFGPPIVAICWSFIEEFIKSKEQEKTYLKKYSITEGEISDIEILEEASRAVKKRKLKQKMEQANLDSSVLDIPIDNLVPVENKNEIMPQNNEILEQKPEVTLVKKTKIKNNELEVDKSQKLEVVENLTNLEKTAQIKEEKIEAPKKSTKKKSSIIQQMNAKIQKMDNKK